MMVRILVCGGRNFTDRHKLFSELDKLCDERGWKFPEDRDGNWLPAVHVISGMCRGADKLAVDWAITNWLDWDEYPADWETHGKSAGWIRNEQMLHAGKPDYVIAFPGGRGTADMVRRAKKAGVPVIEIKA